jgi:hypothetical protein
MHSETSHPAGSGIGWKSINVQSPSRESKVAHYRICFDLLGEFPDTKIVGLFIARRVPEAVDVEDFDGI